MTSVCQRVLVPLTAESDQQRVLLPATVFARWFSAPVQLICDDIAALPGYQSLAAGLGTATEPVLCLDEKPIDGLIAHAHSQAPSLIITEASLRGLRLAARSTQPVLLAADRFPHRLPVGPFVVELTNEEGDTDALALAAVLAKALEESIRLVVDPKYRQTPEREHRWVDDAADRLQKMGNDVGIDEIETKDPHAIVIAGRTRNATAIVVPQARLSEPGMIEYALQEGVNVLIAPSGNGEAGRAAPFSVDLSRQQHTPPDGAELGLLDRHQCVEMLESHTMARLGYVDDGWPTVVPINYRTSNGDIYIRSLAGGKLRAAERQDTVCLELDGYDEQLRSGWSVVAHGVLEVISDATALSDAWHNDPEPWVAANDWQWLRMVPFSLSGRQVLPGEGG